MNDFVTRGLLYIFFVTIFGVRYERGAVNKIIRSYPELSRMVRLFFR